MAFKQRSKGKAFKMMGSSPLKTGDHAEMKEHDGIKKHAHTQPLPNNPDGKKSNHVDVPYATPDIELMSKVDAAKKLKIKKGVALTYKKP